MKFLVLALCVCAVSAASLDQGVFDRQSEIVISGSRTGPGQFALTPEAAAGNPYYIGQSFDADEVQARIIHSDSEVSADGYNYSYETGNGIVGQASGTLKKIGEEAALVSQGTYSYIDTNGRVVTVKYVADEKGFQPQSDILPVGPAIPEAIARALAYIAAHPSTSTEKY